MGPFVMLTMLFLLGLEKANSLDIEYTRPSPSNYFPFEIEFEVKSGGAIYMDHVNITILEISQLGLGGTLSYQTTTGKVTASDLYFEKSGEALLMVIVNDNELDLEFTVNQSKLVISSFNSPSSSAPFEMIVQVANFNESLFDFSFEHKVNLTLIPTGINSGDVLIGDYMIKDAGNFNFTNMQILSSGYFVLKVESENLLYAETEEFFIENLVAFAQIKSKQDSVVIFQLFEIEVKLYGEDFNNYLGSRDVTLNSDPEVIIFENSLTYSYNESLVFLAYAVKSGDFKINATLNQSSPDYSSDQFYFSVTSANIKIEVDPIPYALSSPFTIQVYVVDNNDTILDLASYLQVNLSINCTEQNQCIEPELETQISTLNGFANTSEYRLVACGVYEITAYGEDLNKDSVILKGVVNEVYLSKIFVSEYNITAYQEFEIEVELYGENGDLYDGVTKVTLIYPEGIIVDKATQLYRRSRTTSFTVYSIKSGRYEFQVDAYSSGENYIAEKLSVLVERANIVFEADPYGFEYLTPFAIEVYIVDNNWILLEHADYIQVYLSVNCTDCISPELESQLQTINGKVNSSYVYSIITEGYFEFSAIGEDLNPDSFIIHNGIYNVTNIELIVDRTDFTIYERLSIKVIINNGNDQERFGDIIVNLVYPKEFIATMSQFIYDEEYIYNRFSGYGTVPGLFIFSAVANINGVNFTSENLTVFIEPANIFLAADPFVIFTQPNSIDTPFVIYAFIVNNYYSVLSRADGLSIHLSINCTDNTTCIDPELEDYLITENGSSNSREHVIKKWDNYEIQATGEYLNPDSIFINELERIDINISVILHDNNITVYQEFEIEVKLSTAFEETYSKKTFVNLMYDDDVIDREFYFGMDSVFFKYYITVPGNYEFGISLGICNDFECILEFFTVKVGNANIILDTDFYEKSSSDPFSLQVAIVDNFGNLLPRAHYIYVDLSINCTDYCLDNNLEYIIITNGDAISETYNLLSRGRFEIVASGEYLNSDSVIIEKTSFSISIDFFVQNSKITAYEDFYFLVILNYEDGEEFTEWAEVFLIYPDNFVPTEDVIIYNVHSFNYLSGYALFSGFYDFSVLIISNSTYYRSENITVYIESAKIYIEALPEPWNVDVPFKIYAYIFDNYQDTLENANDFELSLSINCTEGKKCIQPRLEEKLYIENGLSETDEHELQIWNPFKISATGYDLEPASLIIGLNNSLLFANITVYEDNITIYQEFHIEVQIFTNKGPFTEAIQVNLIHLNERIDREYYWGGGSVFFTFYASIPDIYEIGIGLGSCRKDDCIISSFTVEIGKANIILEAEFEGSSSSNFELKASIVDNYGYRLSLADFIDVDLSINCSEYCLDHELDPIFIYGGYGDTRQFSLLYKGYFEIKATGEYLNPDSIIIHNEGDIFRSEIELYFSENFTIYQEFSIYVSLLTEDGGQFYGSSIVSLVSSKEIFVFENGIERDWGFIEFRLYATLPGEYDFEIATSNSNSEYVSGLLKLNISPAHIELELTEGDIDSHNHFKVVAYITDHKGWELPLADLLRLNLSINCSAGVECLDPMLEEYIITQNGTAVTADHRFKSSGDFIITATGANLLPGTILIEDVRNNLKNMSAKVFPEQFSIYTDFNLSITLIGEDDKPYLMNSYLDIYDEQDNYLGYHMNTNGFIEFVGYLYSTNTSFIKVEIENLFIEIPVQVFPLFINFSMTNIPTTNLDSFQFIISIVDIYGQIENKNYYGGEYYLFLDIKNEDFSITYPGLYDSEENYFIFSEYYYTENGVLKSPVYQIVTPGLYLFSIEGRLSHPELVPSWIDDIKITVNFNSIILLIDTSQAGIFQNVYPLAKISCESRICFYPFETIVTFYERGIEIGFCTTHSGYCDIKYVPDEIGNFTIFAEALGNTSNEINLEVKKWVFMPINESLPITNFEVFDFKLDVVQPFYYWPDYYGITKGCGVTMELISLDEKTGYLVGDVENFVRNWWVTFLDIYISEPGEYQLSFFSSNCSDRLENYTTDVFTLKNIENVTIEVVEQDVTIYFDFTLRIVASNDCRGYIKRDDNSVLYEYITTNGVAEVKVYVENTNRTFFYTYCGGHEAKTEYIYPKELNFDLKIVDADFRELTFLDSKQTVFVQVKIVNEMGDVERKNFNNGFYPFFINIYNISEDYSGMSAELNGYTYNFENTDHKEYTKYGEVLIPLRFLSSGTFALEVYIGNNIEINLNTVWFMAKNSLRAIEVNRNFTTVYLPTYLDIQLFGDDGNYFILPLEIQILNVNYENQLLQCANDKGFCYINGLILNKVGYYYLPFNSIDLNTTVLLEARPIVIQVEYFGNDTLTSKDKFSLISYLVDFTETEYIQHSVPDSCILKLSIQANNIYSSSGEIIIADNLSKNSTKGVANYTNVQILSMGIFNLLITPECDFINPWVSEFELINTNFPKMNLEYSKEITVYSYFDLQAMIIGDDYNPYQGYCDYFIYSPFYYKDNITSYYSGDPINIKLYTEQVGDTSGKIECLSGDFIATSYINTQSLKQKLGIQLTSHIPYNFDPFDLSVQLLDKDGILQDNNSSFTYTSEITLKLINIKDNSDVSAEAFAGSLTKKIEFLAEFNDLEINQEGFYIVQASSSNSEKVEPGQTENLSISNIIIPEFKIQFSGDSPTNSSNKFNIQIFVYHSDSIPLENITFTVTFSKLLKNTIVSGEILSKVLNKSYTSNSFGLVTIEDLRVLSAGEFGFSVLYKGQIEAILETGFIENSVESIEVNCSNSAYINFPSTVSYKVFGEDKNEYILETIITISETKNYVFSGLKESSVNNGSFSIKLNSDNIYNLKLSNNLNEIVGTCKIAGKKNNLALVTNFDSLTSVNNSKELNFSVTIYGESIKDIESYTGTYSLIIKATSSGSTSSIFINTKNGIGSVKTQITTPGAYIFTLDTHSQIVSSYSKTLNIIETLKEITYTLNLDQPINTLILIPVQLTGYSGSLFIQKTELSLTCTGGTVENPSVTTDSGTETFYLYSAAQGRIDCSITALGYDYTMAFNFNINQERSNIDPRCLVGYNSTDCYKCVSNSREDANGLCQCTDFSIFNIETSECDCNQGYESSNTYCVTCGYFFKDNQISAYYGENYDSLIIDFNIQASTSTFDCTTAFILTSDLKQFVQSCQWSSSKSFIIYFNQTVPGDIFTLEINPALVQRVKQGACSKDVKQLLITIETKYSKPKPIITINAPAQVSLLCETDIIKVYTTTYGPFFSYTWSTSDKALNSFISTQNGTELQIPSSLLINPSYKIKLKVTNTVLLTSDSSSVTIEILGEKILSVGFSLGDSITYKISETLPLSPIILNTCGESGFTYSWNLLENLVENQEILNKIKTSSPGLLQINPGILLANTKYIVTVTVTSSNNITGSGSISLITTSSDLVVKLSSSSGSLSTDYNVSISTIVSDPDDPENQDFTYKWTCSQEGKTCKGTDGDSLIEDSTSSLLFIDKSRIISGLYYTFIVSVSTPTKSSPVTSEIDVYFSSSIKGRIFLENDYEFVNSDDPIILLPYVEIEGEFEVTWELNPVVEGIDLDLEYLYIPEDYLISGQTYLVKVSLKLKGAQDSTSTTAVISIQVNSPPICSGFDVISDKNNKLTMTPLECADPDSNSHILYQYGIKFGNSFGWLTRPVFRNSFSLRVSGASTAAVKVCDKFFACIVYEIIIDSNPNRNLLVNYTEYESDLTDLDSFPPTIIYYSSFISSQSEYEYLFDNLTYYFTAVDMNKITFDNFVYTLLELIANALNNTELDEEIKYNTSNYLIGVIEKYGKKISEANLERIVEILSSQIDGLDTEDVSGFMDFIGKYGMKGSVIGKSLKIENSQIKFARQRESGKQVNSSLSTNIGSSFYVEFPNDLNIEADYIYDILLNTYYKDVQVFEITLKHTGNLKNGLNIKSIDEEETVNITSNSGILVNISGDFDTSENYKCVYLDSENEWVSGGCKINKVENEYLIATLEHLTIFSIQIEDSECGTGAGPIALMSVLIFLAITVSLLFRQTDITTLNFPKVHKFLLIYPLTSLFFKQPMYRRAVIAAQFFSSQLLILTLIGGFTNYWDDSTDSTNKGFSDFKAENLKSGVAGWILAQVIIIPLFIMNSMLLQNWMLYKTTIPICAFILVGGFSGIVVMTVYYCQGWTEFWIINWLIFFGFDLVTLQVLYSLCLMVFLNPVYVENKKNDSKLDYENIVGCMVPSTSRGIDVDDNGVRVESPRIDYDNPYDAKKNVRSVSNSSYDIIADVVESNPYVERVKDRN